MNRKIPLFALIILLLGVVGQTSATVPQATIVVNSADDVSDTTDGLCTLREAMLAANQNVESGALDDECVAGDNSNSDTITFDLPAGTTIELTGNALTFSDTVTIEGSGSADLTIDAMGLNRVVHVTTGTVVTMTGVTLQGGAKPDNFDDGGGVFTFNGAGILNEGSLLLDDVFVQDNELSEGDGAGIHALDATTAIRNSTIRNNISVNHGGGIFDRDGFMTIEDSVIIDNMATNDGGGIYSTGRLFIDHSDISDNTAGNDGGGVYTSFIMSIMNSTIATNSADSGGGVYSSSNGSLPLVHTTLFNNTGGVVAAAGDLALLNTIVAHSTVEGDDCTGDIDQTSSLDSDGSCGDALTDTPRLDSIATNDAGLRYYALRSNSPAIGQADVSICKEVGEDQNGNERPFGIFCDIGAIESETLESAVFLPLINTQ